MNIGGIWIFLVIDFTAAADVADDDDDDDVDVDVDTDDNDDDDDNDVNRTKEESSSGKETIVIWVEFHIVLLIHTSSNV